MIKAEWTNKDSLDLQPTEGDFINRQVAIRWVKAVEVVRCGECRHRDLFSCPLEYNDFREDDDYCAWGERREEEHDGKR